MARERVKMTAAEYVSVPGPSKPAMAGIDAVSLLEDMVARRMSVPSEVRTAAQLQVNEKAPPGVVLALEEYEGRIRVVSTWKK